MKLKSWLLASILVVLASTSAQAAEVFWKCDLISRNVGGFAIGIGKSVQMLAGEGRFTCVGKNQNGQVVRNYDEKVKLAFLGGGVGIGISLVNSMKVQAVGIQLGKIDPSSLMGTRFGASADVGVHILENAIRGSASVSFSDASGLMFDLSLSELRGLGLYAGAHINGFLIHQENYDGIIVGSLKQIGVIFSEGLKRSGQDITVFSADHVVATQNEAKSRAESEHSGYRNFGINVRKGEADLGGDKLVDFVNQGIRKAHNTCATSSLRTVYAVPTCEGDSCSLVHLRIVCN